jgi:glycosyltransferase involved in cell wall biosynthesis
MERSVALEAHMRTAWVARAPAIVQLEYTTIAHYAALAQATGALTVCTALIVGFVAQVRRIRIERGARVRLRRLVGLLSLWQYELRALRRCDLIITLAESDEYALRRWLPGRPVVTVPSGIDLAAWPTPHKQRDGQLVLFVGNYAHPPNAEGACWLAREVWPLVVRACPDARLVLAGREPTPEIRALACDAISVPGTIDDLGPLHARASIGVAPIFWGGGLRIKLLEMMAAGLPIVATAQAADGLEVASCAILAETPAAFAEAIIGLISDHARRERLGQAARTIAERRYNWTHLAERLAGLYEGLRAGKR